MEQFLLVGCATLFVLAVVFFCCWQEALSSVGIWKARCEQATERATKVEAEVAKLRERIVSAREWLEDDDETTGGEEC